MSKEERLQLENELLFTCSKAQAINNYIDELEESSKLSELWCKSQEEKRELQQRIDKVIPMLDELEKKIQGILPFKIPITEIQQIKKILKGEDNEQSNSISS